MGVKEPKLAFEEEVMAAYNERLKKFKKWQKKRRKKKESRIINIDINRNIVI